MEMEKIQNEAILEYVMNDYVWKLDLPAFLKECQMCSEGNAYDACWNILRRILVILTERCREIDDPVLNIIMLNLSLYENDHGECQRRCIMAMRKIIKEQL